MDVRLLLLGLASGWAWQSSLAHGVEAGGLLADSQLDLDLRHYYAYQHTQRSTYLGIQKPGRLQPTRVRETWVQSAMLGWRSGYTAGVVGFGLNASVFGAANLERGHGKVANGADRVLVDSAGDALSTWSRLAVADVKVRLRDTELKVGRVMTENPILRYKDNRALPSSFQGVALYSQEVEGVSLQAGSFQRAIPRTGTGSERLTTTFGNRQYSGERISYLGGQLKLAQGAQMSLYASRFEDMWQQTYLGVGQQVGDRATLALKTAFNYYHTEDQGAQHLGYIDNDAYSLALGVAHQAHSLTLAWQQIFGDEYFDYVWESTGNYMANSLYSDYNGPNEKSWQVRYDLDFAPLGVPGLSMSLWHAKGWSIDGSHYRGDRKGRNTGYNVRGLDNASHAENGLMLAYVAQSGWLERSVFRTIVYNHRAEGGQVDGSYDEVRLVINVPVKIF